MGAWFSRAEDGKGTVLGALPFLHSYGLTGSMNVAVGLAAAKVLIPNPLGLTETSPVTHFNPLFGTR